MMSQYQGYVNAAAGREDLRARALSPGAPRVVTSGAAFAFPLS